MRDESRKQEGKRQNDSSASRITVHASRLERTPLTPFFNISIISTPQTLSPLNQEDILGPHLYAMVIRQNLPDMDEFKLAHTIPSSHPAGAESMVQNMTEEHP